MDDAANYVHATTVAHRARVRKQRQSDDAVLDNVVKLNKCPAKLNDKVQQLVEKNDVDEHGAVRVLTQQGEHEEATTSSARPIDDDCFVALHMHCVSADDAQNVLFTTVKEQGGCGVPLPCVTGETCDARIFRGIRVAMKRGWIEDAKPVRLYLRDDYAYGQKAFPLERPPELRRGDGVYVDVVATVYEGEARTVDNNAHVVKRVLEEGDGWETPRAPFVIWLTVGATVGAQTFATASEEPKQFTVGDGTLPPALEKAVCAMRVGERANVVVTDMTQLAEGIDSLRPPPSELAAPATAPRPPAPTCAVTYNVKLWRMVQVRDMTGDGSVTKRREVDGVGHFPGDCPLEDSVVRVRYKAVAGDGCTILEQRGGVDGDAADTPFEIRTGMGECCEAIDMSVRLMLPGETSVVTSTAKYAYDSLAEDVRPAGWQGLRDAGRVTFTVQMVDFEKNVNWHNAPLSVLRADALRIKAQGNTLYTSGDVSRAREKYARALRLLSNLRHVPPKDAEDIARSVMVPLQLNIAACAMKQGEWHLMKKHCESVLDIDETNYKARLRRAAASMHIGEHASSRKLLQELLDSLDADGVTDSKILDSRAKEVRAELAKLDARVARHKAKERGMAGRMFNSS